jgi:hypothetical protein
MYFELCLWNVDEHLSRLETSLRSGQSAMLCSQVTSGPLVLRPHLEWQALQALCFLEKVVGLMYLKMPLSALTEGQ